MLAPVRRRSASGRRTGHGCDLRHSLEVRVDLSTDGRGRMMTSTGRRRRTTPHQRAGDADDGRGTGRRHDVEADVELHQDLAGRLQSPLAVVARQLRGDEVGQAIRHYTHTRCSTPPPATLLLIIIIIQYLYSALKSCKGYRGAGGFRLRA